MNNGSPLNQKKDISIRNIIYELTMAFMALIVVSILFIELTMPLTKQQENLFSIIDISILIIFAIDYVFRLIKSKNKWTFIKFNLLDLIAIIPFDKTFRIARLARLTRLIKLSKTSRVIKLLKLSKLTRLVIFTRKFWSIFKGILTTNGLCYTLILTFVIIIFGALGIIIFEPGMDSFSDALWWSLVTTTTVGYGDISPVSLGGRILAGFLMIIGIGFLGMVTGSIATFFINKYPQQEIEAKKSILDEQLKFVKKKLDEIDNLDRKDILILSKNILSIWEEKRKGKISLK